MNEIREEGKRIIAEMSKKHQEEVSFVQNSAEGKVQVRTINITFFPSPLPDNISITINPLSN